MDWIERLQHALDYIEGNLQGEIDWREAGRHALMSGPYFARIFALMSGVPLSEYIRMRRLSLAATDLQQGDARVLDVALRYGYASPTAFQRAFVLFHGVTPSQAHKQGIRLKAYPPIAFQITVKGGIALQYRIEQKPAIRLVGYQEEISMVGGENFVRIPKMWQEFPQERFVALEAYTNGAYPGCFGVIWMTDKPDSLVYAIATASDRTDLLGWMDEIRCAPATYAVFETSLAGIQDTTRRIFAEWLPASGYEHGQGQEFEYYPNGDMSDSTKYLCEIWIPVVKK